MTRNYEALCVVWPQFDDRQHGVDCEQEGQRLIAHLRRPQPQRVVELTFAVPLRACATSASAWRHFRSIVISRSIKADEYRRSIFSEASGDASGFVTSVPVVSTAWRDHATWVVAARCDVVHANARLDAAQSRSLITQIVYADFCPSYRLDQLPEFRRSPQFVLSTFWSYSGR